MRAVEPRLAAMLEPTLGATFAPTLISAGEKINVIPARAEFAGRLPAPARARQRRRASARARELLGDTDGLEIDFTEAVVGNRSPIDVAADGRDRATGSARSTRPARPCPSCCPRSPTRRWFRAAFPDCVAYGFFPQRHQTLYESWPLMHSADERLDVRDLGFATEFFAELPRRLLT